jgi:hypothetical protein
MFHMFKFFNVYWIFQNHWLDKSKTNQIYLKQAKKSKMWCTYKPKCFFAKRLYLTTNFGGLNVFSHSISHVLSGILLNHSFCFLALTISHLMWL